jgi:putative nucleotidyltransferase with HDIG domain
MPFMEMAVVENSAPPTRSASSFQRLAARVEGLPALPLIAGRLLEAVDDPNTSASDLSTLISSDPALAGRLLKMANSAFYGFPRRIGTVNLAVVVLGFETVRDLSLSVLVADCFFQDHSELPFEMSDFWKHSLTTAVCGRMIFRLCAVPHPGEGFIAGLVHDIGKLLLGRYFPEEYGAVIRLVERENMPLLQAEKDVFEISHPEAGAYLLEEWNLPVWLVEAVRDHHGGAEGTAGKLAQAVGFSDFLVRKARFDGGGPRVEMDVTTEMMERLMLKKDVYDKPDYCGYLEKLRRELLRAGDLMDTLRQAP